MDLRNHTDHPADMLRAASARAEDRMLACVIARPTYRIRDGALVRAAPWPIDPAPFETPLGTSMGDKPFYSGGIDVLVGGTVRQPNGVPRDHLDVEIEVGRTFRRRIAVFGDRRWVRDDSGALAPSAPEPFVSMPLAYARAFGGRAATEYGVDMPYGKNPEGIGFCLDEATALGNPLPNLEDPASLVRSVHDMPDPVGLGYYPHDGSLRPLAAIDHPLAARGSSPSNSEPMRPIDAEDILPTVFNAAQPRMILPPGAGPRAGDIIRVSHGLRDGDLAFAMPDLAMHVHVQLEDREHVFPMHLDQIGIVAGEGLVFFSLRSVVEYRIVKGERRTITLHPGPVPAVLPASHRIARPDRFLAQQGRRDA
ncbi:putative exported protein [Minicystis rosea]|nr:putative exported protein [Minicystis rosea]